jgi:hypothetical protein
MKAITIHQPWATLMALCEKLLETRSWATKYRGKIAIHAGKKIDKAACEEPEIKAALARHGYTVDNLPTGAVVAIANLKDIWSINRPYGPDGLVKKTSHDTGISNIWGGMKPSEYHFGDYSDGRFAWETDNVRLLATPIAAKGQQGLWNWSGHVA